MEWIDSLKLGSWSRLAPLGLAVVLDAVLVHQLLRPVVFRLSRFSTMVSAVVRSCDRPMQFLLPLMGLLVLWQGVPAGVPAIARVEHLTGVLAIATVTWLASAAVQGVADAVIVLHPADVADNLHARRIQTQTRVLARIVHSAIPVAGIAFMLMTFPKARQLGASLLASAGIAGLIVGIAARPVFGNLVAGLQITLAQPIRIDDVLIVEGE